MRTIGLRREIVQRTGVSSDIVDLVLTTMKDIIYERVAALEYVRMSGLFRISPKFSLHSDVPGGIHWDIKISIDRRLLEAVGKDVKLV